MSTTLRSSRLDWFWLAALLSLPFAGALYALGRFPGWLDEVQFTDPGVNWFLGLGFVSSCWPYQRPDELFMGNAPGFSALLAGWFSLFGFGLEQARGLVLVQALGAACLMWQGLRKLAPQIPAGLAAAAIAAGFCGVGSTLNLWSARYDALCMLAASLVFAAWVGVFGRYERVALFVAGLLTFFAGFHLVIAAALLCVVLYLVQGREVFARLLWPVLGAAVAGCAWLAVLASHGLVKKFFLITLGSQHTLSGQLAQLVMQGDRNLLSKLAQFSSFLFQDRSWLVGLAGLVVLLAMYLVGRPEAPRRALVLLAAGLVLGLPAGLLLAGKFPIYYVWIAYFPTLFLCAWLAAEAPAKLRTVAISGCLGVFAAAAALGMGNALTQLNLTTLSGERSAFEQWVGAQVPQGSRVFADYEAYFESRRHAAWVFAPTYGQTSMVSGVPEASEIGVIVARAADASRHQALLGGTWQESGRFTARADRRLNYVALRRMPVQAALSADPPVPPQPE